jgi:hypothetical protein
LYSYPGAFGFYQGGAGAVSSSGNGGFGGGGTANNVGACYLLGGAGNFRSLVYRINLFVCLFDCSFVCLFIDL